MGLSHTKEIENAIAEVQDVMKTYRTLIKQTEEASKYLQKWGVASEHAELIAAFALTGTQTEAHKGHLAVLCDVLQNDYLKALLEIQKVSEAVAKQQANVEALEKKVKAGKSQQADLDTAQTAVNAEVLRVQKETETKYKAAALALARAFVKYHEAQAEAQRAVVRGLETATSSASTGAPAPVAAAYTAPAVSHAPPAAVGAAPVKASAPAADDDDDVLPPGPIGAINPSTVPQDEQPPGPVGAVGGATDEPPPPYA
jgi:hypothetical protein